MARFPCHGWSPWCRRVRRRADAAPQCAKAAGTSTSWCRVDSREMLVLCRGERADTWVRLAGVDGLRRGTGSCRRTALRGWSIVDVLLDKHPNVWIRLAIATRAANWSSRSHAHRFEQGARSTSHLSGSAHAWTIQRRVKELQRQVAAAQREYLLWTSGWRSRTSRSILSSGPPAQKICKVRFRPPARPAVREKRLAGLRKTAELARRIHGATVICFRRQGRP